MLGMGGRSRSRGRPRRRWLDEVVKVARLSLQHLKEAARDKMMEGADSCRHQESRST